MRNKKAALELSINAIVIVILAMTLLGLGLMFIRNQIGNIDDTAGQVQDQIRQQILDDLIRGDKKLSFPSDRIEMEGGDEEVISFGVKNTDPADISFAVCLSEIANNVENAVVSDQRLQIQTNADAAFLWDTTTQRLEAAEANAYGITVKASTKASGTRLYKLKILKDTIDTSTNPATVTTAACGAPAVPGGAAAVAEVGEEYTSKTFFVKFT